jgi:hypothetical protein
MNTLDKLNINPKCYKKITREQFNEEIAKFLKDNNTSIKNIFESAVIPMGATLNPPPYNEKAELVKKFFNSPIIFSYLIRNSDDIEFHSEGPLLISNDKYNQLDLIQRLKYWFGLEKFDLSSDSYEHDIYQAIKIFNINLIPYRSYIRADNNENPTQDNFYTIGTSAMKWLQHLKEEFTANDKFIQSGIFAINHFAIYKNIYGISAFLYNLKNPLYLEDCSRMDMNYQWSSISEGIKEVIRGENIRFSSQNEQHNIRFVSSGNDQNGHSTAIFTILDKKQEPTVSILINSEQNKDYHHDMESRYNIVTEKSIKFIYLSLQLQTLKDDYNCSLYAHNFQIALANMISSNEKLADTIVDLAQDNQLKWLEETILYNLKPFLPQYYVQNLNGEFVERSSEEIRLQHLKQRWDVGSSYLKTFCQNDEIIECIGDSCSGDYNIAS